MHATLPELRRALKGLVVMSNELESMGKAMQVNKVPGNWAAKTDPSLKPLGSWAQELWERVDFIQVWIGTGIPIVFWITGFYFSLQNFARKNQLPIDSVDFNFAAMLDVPYQSIKEKPDLRMLNLSGNQKIQ